MNPLTEAEASAVWSVLIGQRIAGARQVRGLSRPVLAKQLSLSRSAVSLWESGQRHLTTGRLLRVAAALSWPACAFLEPEFVDCPGPPTADIRALGESIKARRLGAGLTHERLAEQLQVSTSTISCWELGQRDIYPADLLRLTRYLNTSVHQLLECDATPKETR